MIQLADFVIPAGTFILWSANSRPRWATAPLSFF